ncbi:MAG: tripartite tricarboxylate transporter TctB family protein [Bacteriovoracia bacterium]
MRKNKLNRDDENKIIYQTIKDIFIGKNSGIITEDDKKEVLYTTDKPNKPIFPIMIMGVAVFKDFIDFIQLTGAGIIITILTTLITFVIFFIWMLNKSTSGGWWKRRLMKVLWKRLSIWLLGAAIIEAIPLLGFLPATSIFVLMVHHEEKKIVKLFNEFLETLHQKGIR